MEKEFYFVGGYYKDEEVLKVLEIWLDKLSLQHKESQRHIVKK